MKRKMFFLPNILFGLRRQTSIDAAVESQVNQVTTLTELYKMPRI